jgi:hypothetical protein
MSGRDEYNARATFRRELLPPAKTFYQRELGTLGRPSRGWAPALCCFHKDHRPSLSINLTTGGYFCFSCGAKGGDVIAFVRLRYSLDFPGALRYLNINSTTEYDRRAFRALQRERARREAEQAAKDEEEHRQRIEARDWLHLLERCYELANERLCELREGAPEKFAGESECCWGILADALPQIRQAEQQYLALAGISL